MKRIRVLEILEATIGGTKRHLLDLCGGLDPAEFEVEVACPRVRSEAHGDTSFVDDLIDLGIRVHEVPMVRKMSPVRDAIACAALTAVVWRGRFDVIHAHSSKAGGLGRFAALADPSARFVYSPHGFYYLNFEDPLRARLFRFLEKLNSRRISRLVTLSKGEHSAAINDGVIPAARAELVENGIDHAECLSQSDARARLGIDAGATVVGTISRFTPQKAPFDLIAVAASLAKSRPELVFAWLSDGEMRSQVESALAAAGIEEEVRLLGYVNRARRLIPAMDVFVLASKWEGLPYTIMEAMDAGVPIVATDVVGTQDVIDNGRTGFLVPPGSPDMIAAQVDELLKHPEMAAMIASAAKADVKSRFGRSKMVDKIANLYRDLAGERVIG